MDDDLLAFEARTGAALRAVTARLTALAPAATDDDVLAALGLAGLRRAAAPPRVPRRPPPTLGVAGSIEAWGFAAGQRRVAFVTVAPDQVAATVAQYPGAHVEARPRQVEVGPQDRWRDDRGRGAPRVELFFARVAADARAAAAMQAEDPTRHGAALGTLLGYPPCCVDAFLAQRTRNDNSLNRYLAAARTAAPGPWPWLLDDLHLRLIAFYPCRYDCPAAAAVAAATVAAIDAAHPGATARLRAALGAAVLYLDHDHQVWLAEPRTDGDVVRYAAVAAPGAGRGAAALAALVATGDALALDGGRLTITAGDRPVATADLALGARWRFA